MPSTVGEWLIVILALLVGLLGGWVLSGRLRPAARPEPIVDGDPVVGVTEVEAPATAVVDQDRPAAVVDEAPPPAAVTEEPEPAEYAAPPAAATLAANATPLPGTDPADGHSADEARSADEPVVAEAASDEPVVAETYAEPVEAEPVAVAPEVEEPTAPVIVADAETTAEPVAEVEKASAAAEVSDLPVEPVGTGPTAAGSEVSDAPVAPVAAEEPVVADAPAVVVPAPRSPVEDATATADDFRRIQGVGPKMAAALHAAGIHTYRQLADLDEAALRETVKAAGLRATASLATWPQQASVLAGARSAAEQALPAGASQDA